MDATENDERIRKVGRYKGGDTCGVCGKHVGADYIRCPEDGIICHNNGRCSQSYNNGELNIEQMLCTYSYKAKLKDEERRQKEERIRAAKIILTLLLAATIFLLVKKWF